MPLSKDIPLAKMLIDMGPNSRKRLSGLWESSLSVLRSNTQLGGEVNLHCADPEKSKFESWLTAISGYLSSEQPNKEQKYYAHWAAGGILEAMERLSASQVGVTEPTMTTLVESQLTKLLKDIRSATR